MCIKKDIIRAIQIIFSVLPINKKKIVFLCDGSRYDCNPKYLSEYMGKNTDYIKIWPFFGNVIDKIEVPSDVKKVRIFSIRGFFDIATAGVVISNQRISELIWRKRKGQKYIQTWHSSVRLKKIEKDAENYLSDGYKKLAIKDSESTDIILSGCEFSTDIFKRAFWYDGRIEKTGTPRIDYLLEDHLDVMKKVSEDLNLNDQSILYAPTFREHSELLLNDNTAQDMLSQLFSKTKRKWTFIKRLHPNMRKDIVCESGNNDIRDATNYASIQELLIASDYVITDYSSLMFDCAFLHKPCVLYVPDYEEYLQKERGLYFRLEDLPFPRAYTCEELEEIILHFDRENYEKKVSEFLLKIGSYEDGNACKRIVSLIEKELC
jgi:CDP-glycerol glycerophosphotransferase